MCVCVHVWAYIMCLGMHRRQKRTSASLEKELETFGGASGLLPGCWIWTLVFNVFTHRGHLTPPPLPTFRAFVMNEELTQILLELLASASQVNEVIHSNLWNINHFQIFFSSRDSACMKFNLIQIPESQAWGSNSGWKGANAVRAHRALCFSVAFLSSSLPFSQGGAVLWVLWCWEIKPSLPCTHQLALDHWAASLAESFSIVAPFAPASCYGYQKVLATLSFVQG